MCRNVCLHCKHDKQRDQKFFHPFSRVLQSLFFPDFHVSEEVSLAFFILLCRLTALLERDIRQTVRSSGANEN